MIFLLHHEYWRCGILHNWVLKRSYNPLSPGYWSNSSELILEIQGSTIQEMVLKWEYEVLLVLLDFWPGRLRVGFLNQNVCNVNKYVAVTKTVRSLCVHAFEILSTSAKGHLFALHWNKARKASVKVEAAQRTSLE